MRDPFKLPGFTRTKFRSLRDQLEMSQNRPYIGVTQGGSSRDWPGCKVAATSTPKPPKRTEND